MMRKYMYLALLLIVGVLLAWTVVSYLVERSVKTPPYTLLEEKNGYELRLYEPYIMAQVEVEGDFDSAINEGFRILADYIFGNNTKEASIAMTAPVTESKSEKIAMTAPVMVKDSEKIAMTAPVLENETENGRIVTFVMPFEYTLDTLPKPNNPRITIVQQDSRKVAVLPFSWFMNSKKVEEKKSELLLLLERDGLVPKGTPEYAGYNAPFTAPWLVKNEIMVELE